MRKLLALGIVFLSLVACQKTPEAPNLTLSGSPKINLPADGKGSITFTTNKDWTASVPEAWVHLSQTSGASSDGPVTVSFSCDPNPTYDDRSATITIRAGELSQTVTVIQPAKQGLLVVGETTRELASEAESLELEVQANVNYAVSIDVDWIRQIGTKGLTSDKLSFAIEKNGKAEDRSGKITVTGAGMTQEVVVKQTAKVYPYVELGDGLKWATFNVGAEKETDFGDYFAWGETEPYYVSQDPLVWKDNKSGGYTISSYFDTDDGGATFKKYNESEGKKVLDDKDDTATANWGGPWRMPTVEEWKKLLDREKFTWTWTNDYKGTGVKGKIVTSKITGFEGNEIFFPAAYVWSGVNLPTSMVGVVGIYWTSSLGTASKYAQIANIRNTSTEVSTGGIVRSDGATVRPVCE